MFNPLRITHQQTLRGLRKIIRVIREIRVQQKTYASHLNNDSRVLRKIIRVIREIRVRKPYASHINMTLRVLRKIIREIRVRKPYASRNHNSKFIILN